LIQLDQTKWFVSTEARPTDHYIYLTRQRVREKARQLVNFFSAQFINNRYQLRTAPRCLYLPLPSIVCLPGPFPRNPHAGPKPSDSSKPACLLMEKLTSHKTGAHCQQCPHVQLLKKYGQCKFSQQNSHKSVPPTVVLQSLPVRQYVFRSKSNNSVMNSAKHNFTYLTTEHISYLVSN
jgi:hypothetical protein